VRIEARAPLTLALPDARFCALSAHAYARLSLPPAGPAPMIADPVLAAAVAALAPPQPCAVQVGGPPGPGAEAARLLALLAALNVTAGRLRALPELAALGERLARRGAAAVDAGRLLAAARGGLVAVRETPDGPAVEDLPVPAGQRLWWWPASGAWAWGGGGRPAGAVPGPDRRGLRVVVRGVSPAPGAR
jgi:hypothetical protein